MSAFTMLRSTAISAGIGLAFRRAEPTWTTLAPVVIVLSVTRRRSPAAVGHRARGASRKLLSPETVDGSIRTTGIPAGQVLVPVNGMIDCPGGNIIVWFWITTHPGHRGGGGRRWAAMVGLVLLPSAFSATNSFTSWDVALIVLARSPQPRRPEPC